MNDPREAYRDPIDPLGLVPFGRIIKIEVKKRIN
jgi:hypothetical protein